MKHKKLLSLACLIVLVSSNCLQKENSTEKILAFIPGTYVRTFEGEYASGHDTLIIARPNTQSNYYTIKHNSSYQRIIEKKLHPLEYKSESWIAMFSEKDNVLVEQKRGKLISFLPEQNVLLLGSSKFSKIK